MSASKCRQRAGYQCLGCKQMWPSIFSSGQDAGSPYTRGTQCWIAHSAAELCNVPRRRAHLATRYAHAVPIYALKMVLVITH